MPRLRTRQQKGPSAGYSAAVVLVWLLMSIRARISLNRDSSFAIRVFCSEDWLLAAGTC